MTNTDFEFLAGEWTTVQRRLVAPLSGSDEWYEFEATASCQLLLGGNATFDVLRSPQRNLEGLTLRLYDAEDKVWRIWWASNNTGGKLDEPVAGGFADGLGTFECDDTFQGRPVRVEYEWSRVHTDTSGALGEQAFSARRRENLAGELEAATFTRSSVNNPRWQPRLPAWKVFSRPLVAETRPPLTAPRRRGSAMGDAVASAGRAGDRRPAPPDANRRKQNAVEAQAAPSNAQK